MQGCILDCAEMMDVVAKKGAWYSYADHRSVSEVLILIENPFSFLQLQSSPFSILLGHALPL